MRRAFPTEFRGKTWIFVVQALVFGGFAVFGLVFGPLFWLGIRERADGRPATDAGIFLTSWGVLCFPIFALAVFNIVARWKPILRICREGVEMTIIGSTSLDGVPFVPGPIRVAWAILTTQGFRKRIVRVAWGELRQVEVSGLPMARKLTVITSSSHSETVMFREHVFESPLNAIALAVSSFAEDDEARDGLTSWDVTEW